MVQFSWPTLGHPPKISQIKTWKAIAALKFPCACGVDHLVLGERGGFAPGSQQLFWKGIRQDMREGKASYHRWCRRWDTVSILQTRLKVCSTGMSGSKLRGLHLHLHLLCGDLLMPHHNPVSQPNCSAWNPFDLAGFCYMHVPGRQQWRHEAAASLASSLKVVTGYPEELFATPAVGYTFSCGCGASREEKQLLKSWCGAVVAQIAIRRWCMLLFRLDESRPTSPLKFLCTVKSSELGKMLAKSYS